MVEEYMKKREFWEKIVEQDGSCAGIACDVCRVAGKRSPDLTNGFCPTKIKHEIGEAFHSLKVEAARLADAKDWLARHPKKEKPCPDCANYKPAEPKPKPFITATEFIPGKFYLDQKSGEIVLCQNGEALNRENFYGVTINGEWIGYSKINPGWRKSFFSGPVDVEIKVKE